MTYIECPVCGEIITDDNVIINDGALVCPDCGTPIGGVKDDKTTTLQ